MPLLKRAMLSLLSLPRYVGRIRPGLILASRPGSFLDSAEVHLATVLECGATEFWTGDAALSRCTERTLATSSWQTRGTSELEVY